MTTNDPLLYEAEDKFSDAAMLRLGEQAEHKPLSEMTNLEMSAFLFLIHRRNVEAESSKEEFRS